MATLRTGRRLVRACRHARRPRGELLGPLKRPGLERDRLDRRLLNRDLPALYAFVAVEELGEVLGLVGVDPDDDPGLTPGLLDE